MRRSLLSLALLVALPAAALAQKEYGFDNRKPSGQPYLSPEETVRRMKVADGFEVKLFAAEPMVVNPVAMTIDEKGRLWVIECFEYPKRTPPGKMPRDRIIILEDTDGDGAADKRTVFAEGKDFPQRFDLATGIEVGHGGVFVGAAPYLWFLKDTNGDDKADKFEILLKGFGSQDTHETLNTFQWGPDGWLYGLHGIYTQSKITSEPGASATGQPPVAHASGSDVVEMNAAIWRYHPVTKKFEVFAEGTSNPWGWDYRNTDGQMILACCVIPHLYHIVPGGYYRRQSGQGLNPYAYGELKEICDHTFHRESGWAHAGLISLDTPLMPPEYRDSVIFGSIHGCSIKRNVLKPNGSTFTASRADDFLVSGDKNFRPINLRWGPNGDIFCIDWHDQNPCHQTPPDNWDYERGRVYRIQKKGAATKRAEDLGAKTKEELGRIVINADNPWYYRTSLRLLHEQPTRDFLQKALEITGKHVDFPAISPMRGAWLLNAAQLVGLTIHSNPSEARIWAIRGLSDNHSEFEFNAIVKVAKGDTRPEIGLALASFVRRANTRYDTLPILHLLLERKDDATDPVIPLMLWLAYEPQLAAKPVAELNWLMAHAPGNPLITDHIVPRAMRRLLATGKAEDLAACVTHLGAVKDVAVRVKALEGLNEALKGRLVDMPDNWIPILRSLQEDTDPQVRRLTRSVAVHFRDPAMVRRMIGLLAHPNATSEERLHAARGLALSRSPDAVNPLLALVRTEPDIGLRTEAARGLASFDRPDLAKEVLSGWKAYPPVLRGELVHVLAGHRGWAKDLLAAVAAGTVEKTTLNANTILRMRAFNDRALNRDIESVWGRVRDTPADLNQLLTTMRGELAQAPASFIKGKAVFEAQCAKCHQFDGKGHNVGPAIDGAARDIEYLLTNVLDPNRVVGQPYFVRRVILKSGRIEEGLLHAEDPQTITLKGENDAHKVISKADVESVEVAEKSVMPEGLANNMSVQDLRDLVRYTMAHPFVTDWQVAGPFPDRQKDLLTTEGPGLGGAKWNAVRLGVPGRLDLPPTEKDGYAYLWATVESSAAFTTRLQLGSAQPMRVFANGRQVYDDTPGEKPANPDQASVPVEVKAGRNTLLIEVRYRGNRESVYARLLDPDRKLLWPDPPGK